MKTDTFAEEQIGRAGAMRPSGTSARRCSWARALSIFGSTALVLSFLTGAQAMAYESNYSPTEVGKIEVKDLPATRALEAAASTGYFEGGNRTFMTLFRYIRSNELAMTIPVEAEITPARMRFFVDRNVTRKLPSGDSGVNVLDLPARKVVSLGLRGGYSQENFEEGVTKLREWLAGNPDWVAKSEPYAVYWNGPFTIWFAKRSEAHIRISPR